MIDYKKLSHIISGTRRVALDPSLEGAPSAELSQVGICIAQYLAMKYQADVAYRSFADRVTGPWRDALVAHWQEHAEEERKASYDLAMKLVGMGIDPNVETISLSCSNDLPSLFKCLADLEYKMIAKGRELIQCAGDHTSLVVMAENMILTDTQHLDDIRRMSKPLFSQQSL